MKATSFAEVAQAALATAESLLRSWLPDGKREGQEWVARNPTRADRRPGSFGINIRTGKWADFATGDKGGDLISLRAYLDGTKQGEAAGAVAADLGLQWGGGGRTGRPRFAAKRRPITTPAPQAEPEPEPKRGAKNKPRVIKHQTLGIPTATWLYTDAESRPLGYACRFHTGEGQKAVIPYSWNGTRWAWKAMQLPRPLYSLPDLRERPEAVVIITEGEKAADAAAKLLPEAVCTTWAGGCKAWDKTDWQPLQGRRVILWPDNDSEGIDAMRAIHAHLNKSVMAARVHLPTLPGWLPGKFDAADIELEFMGRRAALNLLDELTVRTPTPDGSCHFCWLDGILAQLGGRTCKHADNAWKTLC
jgi:putative DNA primase/helicase